MLQHKRTAALASSQAKKPFTRTIKSTKEVQIKAKRLMREMMVFWRKNEKEERDLRKRAEKEADNRLKEEEERREAARQARKLEFLISQTELYSHFVGNKLKSKLRLIPLCTRMIDTRVSCRTGRRRYREGYGSQRC
jgi:DNA helicase INO80